MKRLLTGLSLAAFVIVLVWFAPPPAVWAAIGVGAVLASEEVRRILAGIGMAPWREVLYPGTLALIAAMICPAQPVAMTLATFALLLFARALMPTQRPEEGMHRIAGTLLPMLWIGLSLGHVAAMLAWGLDAAAVARGRCLILLLAGIVYIGDTFALYGGKLTGRHKLAPGISPKKTWEGAFWGIVGSVVWALGARATFFRDLPLGHAIGMAVVGGVVGVVGDLAESLLKRGAAVKDSGALLPGHGGVFDRLDSLLLAAPVVYWWDRLLLH
ncbi:MAG: phosphatidate cytidylyltransferase [Candidatus Polarisedimenticolia bacterium]|nr:phosphatidate cytidylyltransferase [bacterium]